MIGTNMETRIKRLVNDYVIKISDCNTLLEDAVVHLKEKIGTKKINQLVSWIEEREYSKVAEDLITNYYDPLYKNSVDKYNYIININYVNIKEAIDMIAEFYYELEYKSV